MGQLHAGAARRAGRSASARRLNLNTRSLRIGVVYNGRIVQERLMPPGGVVTVGSDPGCTVVVVGAPRRFTLIETKEGSEAFHFHDGMRGKVALGGRVRTLDGLLADGRARRGRRRCSMKLRPEHRGKVKVGDTTILFQFVRTPPMPARVRQSKRFGAWQWNKVDWIFLAVLLLSGLVHTAAMIWIESQPPPSVEAIREIGDRFFVHYEQPPPPETTPEPVEVEDDLLAAAPDPEPVEQAEPDGDGSADAGVEADAEAVELPPETAEERQRRLRAEVEGQGIIAVIGTAGNSSTDRRVRDLLADGTVGDPVHEAVASASTGFGRDDEAYGLRAGSQDDAVASSGSLGEADGAEGARLVKEDEELKGSATAGTWEPPPGDDVAYDVSGQMKRYLGQMKRCYEKELKSEPDLAGKIVLSWTIQADGDVAGVSVDRDSTGNADLQACVAKAMGRLRFAAPKTELDVEGYPLIFDRQ